MDQHPDAEHNTAQNTSNPASGLDDYMVDGLDKVGIVDIFNRGLQLYKAEKYDEALETFQNLATMAPHASEVSLNLGNIHYRLDELDKAEEAWLNAIGLDPLEANAYLNLGNLYFRQDKLPTAVRYWEQFKKLNKNYANVYLNLGIAYDKLDDPERALENYSIYTGIEPNSSEAIRLRYRFETARKAFENNIQVAEKALGNGSLDQAMGIFAKALSTYPGNARIYRTYANLLYRKQAYGDALMFYQKAFDKEPDNAPVLINMGVIFEKTGRPVDALWAYYRAKDLPSREQAKVAERYNLLLGSHQDKLPDYLNQAQSLFRQDKQAEAVRRIMRLSDLKPVAGTLAGEIDEWRERIEEAANPRQRAAKTYYNMGQDAESQGQFDRAIAFYEKYLSIDPKGETAREIRNRLSGIKKTMGAVVSSLLEQPTGQKDSRA